MPQEPNFAWEVHLDEDGIERTYACCDVLIFTALYEEAVDIVGKSQSMELYEPSIKGFWTFIEGKKFYKFEEACFLGLQILGDDVEPCFEGAAFFSLYNDLKDLLNKMEEYGINFQLKKEEKSEMEKLNFKLSDSQKHDALWSLLNSSYNQENDWMITYGLCEVFDDYAIAWNYEDNGYERVYYIKDNNADTVEITKVEKCYYLDVTDTEKKALEALRQINNGTYEKIDETVNELQVKYDNAEVSLQQASEKNVEYEQKIEELNDEISTLTTDKAEAETAISTLTEELKIAKDFIKSKEDVEKKEIMDSYLNILPEEILSTYTEEKISAYTALDLDKELAYELKKFNKHIFSNTPKMILKEEMLTGVDALLMRYDKN